MRQPCEPAGFLLTGSAPTSSRMRSTVRLTASATRTLPRWLLLAICLTYAATGLFGRDPWKNEDAAGFGVMWTMAHGHLYDWLLPNLVGKPVTADGPLVYWLGALSMHMFTGVASPSNAARVVTGLLFCAACALVWYGTYLLGRRAEVQPFKFAFGGEPAPRDYGRTLADGALLIVLGCFGLAERGHETTPGMAQFAAVAVVLYGAIRTCDKPAQGACWWGGGLALLTLASNPVISGVVAICTLVLLPVVPAFRTRRNLGFALGVALPLGVLGSLAWPALALACFSDDAARHLRAWSVGNFASYQGPFGSAVFYALKNLPLFAWPAWPLAAWSWFQWRGLRRAPHVAIPAAVSGAILLLLLLQSAETNRSFLLVLPGMSILAAFALPTLKRDAINAIDWFAILSFTIIGSFVWTVWIASLTGFPASTARNLARLVPGFQQQFHLLSLVIASSATLAWIALVRWRVARTRQVLWRSVILTSAGTTLMWVLLMTLWLPIVNYSRTYREVAAQIAVRLPEAYRCIRPARLSDAQVASFAYFGAMRFAFADEDCDVLLRYDPSDSDFDPPASVSPYAWKFVWEGRRPADRDERFRLYIRMDRPVRGAHR
jgi:4-amino-4-deoxy-L-arabinose transferase-like glycosyltransferase